MFLSNSVDMMKNLPGVRSPWVLRMPIKIGNIPLFKQLVIRFLSSFCQRFFTQLINTCHTIIEILPNAGKKSLGYKLVFEIEISYNGQMIFNQGKYIPPRYAVGISIQYLVWWSLLVHNGAKVVLLSNLKFYINLQFYQIYF